jgi:Tfp pilus assembly protein PilN
MRAVNLLPKEIVREGGGLPRGLHLVGAAAVPVLAISFVIFGWTTQRSALSVKRAELATLTAEIPAPVKVTKAVVDTTPLIDSRTQRLAALDNVLVKRVPWDIILRDLGRVLPTNVWLTALTATAPVRTDVETAPVIPVPGTPPANTFTISGYTYTEQDVAVLLQRVQLLPTLTNVALGAASKSAIGERELIQFDITAAVKELPGSVPVPVPVPAPAPVVAP